MEEKCGGGGAGAVRVLVVDDSPVDRKVVERLLSKSGGLFEVISVDSGRKAMEILGLDGDKDAESNRVVMAQDRKKIDIILTDYCMPEMNGFELLKAVKENVCSKSIPVVLMSSEDDPQRIDSCRAIGAEDFIIKPLKTESIQRLRSCTAAAAAAAAAAEATTPKAGTKRKLTPEMMSESNEPERQRPCLAGVAVA